ncbi:unnamed protein product [Brassicogethes aeneus]|uniref:Uncharacterized protein n=1 Tax=Brassicogethes aeneus TaxID=1431903 RepID=A0A9P0BCC8_BRAAE|nr:unnamed protein product [Brassicogethes aeneus]
MERSQFKCGVWSWDDDMDELIFNSKEPSQVSDTSLDRGADSEVFRMRETLDSLEQAQYRKLYQRRVKIQDPEVVTLQDVKDIIIYLINPKDLSPEFIQFVHTPSIDRFFRALIVYFQFFIETYENVLERRELAARSLRNANVERNEAIISENMADLRSVVSKEFSAILMGSMESMQFHHMNTKNNTSLTGKDRRQYECLINFSSRVVWITHWRKYLANIEVEINRLIRSDYFNIVERKGRISQANQLSSEEKKIIFGENWYHEKKLKQKSPIVQEILTCDHDVPLMTINVYNLSTDERSEFLSAAFSFPEEDLAHNGIALGCLGWPRVKFDAMLKLIPRNVITSMSNLNMISASEANTINLFVPPETFDLPAKAAVISLKEAASNYNRKEDVNAETLQCKTDRVKQKNIWLRYLKNIELELD